jgi:predicted nucleotidyltransferase
MSERPAPADVVAIVRDVFDDALMGAYLFGSATMDGLRPHSDLDVLAVLDRRSGTDERSQILARVAEISGSRAVAGPSRPVELTLVVQADVRPWRYPPRQETLYGEWLRDDYEAGFVPEPGPNPDLATVLTMVLANGRALHGPPASDVLDPVPIEDLRRAMIDTLPELLTDLETDRNVALTLARTWYTLETDQIVSKHVAADWTLARLPADLRPPLEQARDVYIGSAPDTGLDVPRLRAYATWLLPRIGKAARAAARP